MLTKNPLESGFFLRINKSGRMQTGNAEAANDTGSYRMRVIAGCGTDCYTESANGFGACGVYQYGNFEDFTLYVAEIATGTNPAALLNPQLKVSPNQVTELLTVDIPKHNHGNTALLHLIDAAGIVLLSNVVLNER